MSEDYHSGSETGSKIIGNFRSVGSGICSGGGGILGVETGQWQENVNGIGTARCSRVKYFRTLLPLNDCDGSSSLM